jgi:iduronate 2-sulfatase
MDAQIGKVIAELDRLDLARNTIIVVWGDHGFHLGDLGIWTKHTNYEQANRIPLLLVAPGVTRADTVTRQLAESVDLFPTLAELAGLPAPEVPQPLSGKSLVPVLKDPARRIRDRAFHCYPRRGGVIGRAIRTERYRMVEWKKPGAPAGTAQYELYDYRGHPVEQRNLAQEQGEVLARLKGILARYPEAVGR